MSNRITHIRKPNVNSPVEHITHVRVVNSNGTYDYTVPQIIAYMKDRANIYEFFVQVGTQRADVTYQTSAQGNEYIKTKPDATQKDNLLSLAQF